MTCDDYFANALTRLQDEQRYRVFVEIERIAGHCPFCGLAIASRPEKIAIWCSNDYLGMSQHPNDIRAMADTACRTGTGAGGTRNIAGTNSPLVKLALRRDDLL